MREWHCCDLLGDAMGLLRMFQRRKVRTAFGDYLSPEVIRRLLLQTDSQISALKVQHFQFVVVVFEEANPQEVSALMSGVVGTLLEYKATVTSLSPAFLVGLFGVPFPMQTRPRLAGQRSSRCFEGGESESGLPTGNATRRSATLVGLCGSPTMRRSQGSGA